MRRVLCLFLCLALVTSSCRPKNAFYKTNHKFLAAKKPTKRKARATFGGSGSNQSNTLKYSLSASGNQINANSTFKEIYGIKSVTDGVEFDENVKSGLLTGAELSDFDKWELWQHLSEEEFEQYRKQWEIEPANRYLAQVMTKKGRPLVDAPIELYDGGGRVIWNARTDNTGKAELWGNGMTCSEIKVYVNGTPYSLENPHEFDTGINRIEVDVECNVSEMVDIAFVVDATGSMEDEIQYLQVEMEDIISRCSDQYEDLTFNTASVFCRCTGNLYSYITSDFTTDEKQTGSFIKQQSAREGGEEIVDSALYAMTDLINWSDEARARIAFLILDEPPKADSLTKLNLKKYIAKSAEKGIRIIPLVASANYGTEKSLEYLMRSVALLTNGSYVFLTDDSGIGDPHAKPSIDEYRVELLNSLMTRLIFEYTFVPTCDEPVFTDFAQDTIVVQDIINRVVVDSALMAFQDSIQSLDKDTIINHVAANPDDDGIEQDEINWDDLGIDIVDEIKIYPNPTRGNLIVEVTGEATEVYVADLAGKLIARYPLNDDLRAEFDISNNPAGIYLVQCQSRKKWLSGKVVLMR